MRRSLWASSPSFATLATFSVSPPLSLSSKKRPWLEGGRSVGHLVHVEDPQGKSARSVNHGSFDFMIIVISSIIMCARSLFRASSLPVPCMYDPHNFKRPSIIIIINSGGRRDVTVFFNISLSCCPGWSDLLMYSRRRKAAFLFRRCS